jgi:hypothetical protein
MSLLLRFYDTLEDEEQDNNKNSSSGNKET